MSIYSTHALVRRWRAVAVVVVAIGAAAQRAHAQTEIAPRGDVAAVAARVEPVIAETMKRDGIPALSIALVAEGEIVWARGFGIARSADSTPATAETAYRAGSLAKLVTDLAIMRFVERGTLALDTPITRYAGGLRVRNPYAGAVTLRALMSHRSGVVREPPGGGAIDSGAPTLVSTVASLGATTLVYPPGARMKYSDAGVAAAALVLERAAGAPAARVIDSALFVPLGMTSSAIGAAPALAARLADGRMWSLDGRRFAPPRFALGTAPANDLTTTVLDLARLASALVRGGRAADGTALLSSAMLDTMFTPQLAPRGATTGYGLGFRIGRIDGRRTVGHDGALYGHAAALRVMPDEHVAVVVCAALDGATGSVERIADAALRALLARRDQPRADTAAAATTLDRAAVNALVARYAPRRDPRLHALELLHRGAGVAVLPDAGGGAPLLRASGDTLRVDDPVIGTGARYRVIRGDGAPLALVAEGEHVDTLWREPAVLPAAPPARFAALIGQYGPDYNLLNIHERAGRLWALVDWFFPYPLTELGKDSFAFPPYGLYDGEQLTFVRDRHGRVTAARLSGASYARRAIEPRAGTNQLRVRPVRPIPALRAEALAATPPADTGTFRPSELVEVRTLEPRIKLEIRYATTNNFLGARLYDEARAFLQRPAAEAVVRAHRALARSGYGLLIHDAYRPWYVTKIFWDATPLDKRWLVADPAQGSKHNRGAAVDLTLYDLRTGRAVEMPSTYDESTDRAMADYPGGTARQRWLRELLRQAMEHEGFAVNPQEWWHFDFADWRSYRLGNAPFSALRRGTAGDVGKTTTKVPAPPD